MGTTHKIIHSCDECGAPHDVKRTTWLRLSRAVKTDVYFKARSLVTNVCLCPRCADKVMSHVPNIVSKA